VDVPNLSSSEAPVALRYTTLEGVEEKVEEFRGFDGRLYHDISAKVSEKVSCQYERFYHHNGLFDRQMAAVSGMVERLERQSGTSAYKQMHPSSFGDATRRRIRQQKLELVSDMDLRGEGVAQSIREQIDDFRQHIRDMVIIDNRFYLPEPEPLLALVPVWAGHIEVRVVRAGRPVHSLAKQGLQLHCLGYFRFDEIDRLEVEAAIMANRGQVERRFRDVEIEDGNLLVADTDRLTLMGLAATFTQYFASSLVVNEELEGEAKRTDWMVQALFKLTIEQFSLYKRLVRGMEAHFASDDTNDLEAAVLQIMESPIGSLERRTFMSGNDIPRQAAEIVRRWNDREVRLDQRFEPSWKP
jgi:hypothetical protein